MRFRFQTTVWQFAEDSQWGAWIAQTDIKRKVNCGLALLLTALFAGFTIYRYVAWNSDVAVPGGLTLLMAIYALVTILWNKSWMAWKKQFVQVSKMEMGKEDGPLTIELTDGGCVLYLPDETIERFRWENVAEAYTWSEGWDMIDKYGFSGISLRKGDLTEGDIQVFESFLQQKIRKPLKPRAIELDELKHRYKIGKN